MRTIKWTDEVGGRMVARTKELTMYAIAGVTGHTGSIAAETLLGQGTPVRVIVRDAAKGAPWKAKGAEVAVAELQDQAAVQRALTGVDGAFVLLPPNPASTTPVEDNAKLAAAFASAVKAANLPHVVLLSSVGAHLPGGTGPIAMLHRFEHELAATGAGLTAVRASYFQENWGASLGMLDQGVLPTFVKKDVRFPQVATRDIGRTVARALVEGGARGKTRVIELGGPRDYSAADVAKELSSLTGKTITAQEAPLDAVVPTFTSFGMSNASAELYRQMYEGFNAARITIEPGHQLVRGTVELRDTLAALLRTT
jgi:uncharacterized protein YbjT (DUF2867 family)